jgi:peptidyl-prolyl cis-trans isomerase A (cyclophilin A)
LYNNTVIHRSVPGFVIQGGGFTPDGNGIQTFPPIVNEFSPSRPNVAGTIAMAKTSDPNSATSQWFINLADNSSSLDDTANSGGFTVFGSVINNTMSTVNAIAALPVADGSSVNAAWDTIPVLQQVPPGSLTPSNYVTVSSAVQLPESTLFTYSATSDNPSLVSPSVSGTGLTLNYPSPGSTGVANITVTATDSADGSTSSQTFLAAVGVLPVTLGTGGEKSVSFTSPAGKVVQISYAGPGSAAITFTGTGLTSTVNAKHKTATVTGTAGDIGLASVTTAGTTAKSALTFGGARGASIGLGSLTTSAPIGTISGAEVTFTGNLTAGGTIGKLILGPVTGSNITLTSASAVTLGNLTTSNVTASGSIKALTVKGAETGSNITLTGTAAGKATDLGKLVVTSAISTSKLISSGNLGSLSAAAVTDSSIYAGVTPAGGAALPSTLAEFSSQSSISAVKVGTFTGSDLSAYVLGKLSLGSIPVSNGGVQFGVAAASIAALAGRTDQGGKLNLKKLTTEATLTAQLAKEKISLAGTDLLISII